MHVANQHVHVHCVHVHLPVGLADIGNFVQQEKWVFWATNERLSPRNNFFYAKKADVADFKHFWHLVTQCLYFFSCA